MVARTPNHAATLAVAGWRLCIGDRVWTIVEVATSGEILAFADAPYYDLPGCAYYKWLTPSEAGEGVRNSLESRYGW